MTNTNPQSTSAIIANAVAAADRAAMGLRTAIALADNLHELQIAIALHMLAGDIGHAVDQLRNCGRALGERGDMQ